MWYLEDTKCMVTWVGGGGPWAPICIVLGGNPQIYASLLQTEHQQRKPNFGVFQTLSNHRKISPVTHLCIRTSQPLCCHIQSITVPSDVT